MLQWSRKGKGWSPDQVHVLMAMVSLGWLVTRESVLDLSRYSPDAVPPLPRS
jgi:hypothetical protein